MAKISVVIPVYGVEKYINQMLDSIRRQTFQDFEVVFVDDGSPDNCPKILDKFAEEDKRYHIIHQGNGGVSKARNTGIVNATGEYLYLADSDDWLEDHALEDLWKAAQSTNADLIYGDWISEKTNKSEVVICFPHDFVTEDQATLQALQYACNNFRKIRVKRPEFDYIRHLGGAPWHYMVKRSIVTDNNLLFDVTVKGIGDDILFALQLYEHVRKVAYIQKIIYHYRIIDESCTHGFKHNIIECHKRTLARMEQFISDNNKGESTKKAYYNRVLLYFEEEMERYFKNQQNPETESYLYKKMKELVKTEPYKTANIKAPIFDFYSKRLILRFLLLRLHLYKIYWKQII